MKSYSRILKWVAALAMLAACVGYVVTLNFTAAHQEMVADISENLTYFQNFILHGLDGETFTQDDLKGYKVTVINGWATWCNPCTGEMPDLQELSEEYADKGLQIIGVVADYDSGNESDEDIRSVVKACGVTYPILVSDDAFAREPYITMESSFPCTWAVDEDGNVIEIIHGSNSKEKWQEYFDKWLDEE